jgi:hypothetical protein
MLQGVNQQGAITWVVCIGHRAVLLRCHEIRAELAGHSHMHSLYEGAAERIEAVSKSSALRESIAARVLAVARSGVAVAITMSRILF